jgi:hypothetical protein
MTGTPLDNKRDDGYTLLSMLHGHPITSFLLFQAAFLESLPSGLGFPEGYYTVRYIQIHDASSLRRIHTVIEQEFPELHRKVIITFLLNPEDRRRSNNAYKLFKKSRRGVESLRVGNILYRPSSMLTILCWLSLSLRSKP